MAPPVKPPATLPADFNGWDKPSGPPAVLPENFAGWDKPASSAAPSLPPAAPPAAPGFVQGLRNNLAKNTQMVQPNGGFLHDYVARPLLNTANRAGQAVVSPILNGIDELNKPTDQQGQDQFNSSLFGRIANGDKVSNGDMFADTLDKVIPGLPFGSRSQEFVRDAKRSPMDAATNLAGDALGMGMAAATTHGAGQVASKALKGTGFVSKVAAATPEARKVAYTRALVPGSPAELLNRALKPPVTMPDFEQSVENSLPKIAAQNSKGVSGFADAAKNSQNAEQDWYKGITDPLRQFKVDASPIADAQLKSIPIMDRIEKPATLQGGSPGRMKTVTVPAGEGTKMTMGGIVGASPAEMKGGIFNHTADVANNYRRPMPLGVVDDVRQDSNAKLNAFFAKSGGDKYAALSNPETARVASVNDASRDLAYNNFARLSSAGRTDVPTLPEITSGPNVSRLSGIPQLAPGPDAITADKIASNQKLFGDLSDVAKVAGKRATVAGRANPMSLQETLALKPSPMGVVDYAGQRLFKGLTNSDALTNAAVDRFKSPNSFILPPRSTGAASALSATGKGLTYLGNSVESLPTAPASSLFFAPRSKRNSLFGK